MDPPPSLSDLVAEAIEDDDMDDPDSPKLFVDEDRHEDPPTAHDDCSEEAVEKSEAETPIEEWTEVPTKPEELPTEVVVDKPADDEAELPRKVQAEDADTEMPMEDAADELQEEATDDVAMEAADEPVEEAEEAAIEPVEEAALEAVEEAALEPTEEAALEPVEEATDEPRVECAPTDPSILLNLQNQIESQERLLKQHQDNADVYRQQRDSAIQERNSLMDIVARLNSEINHLKDTYSQNSAQLRNTLNSSCEIVAKNGELKTKELSLKCREELLDQERKLLNDKIHTLAMELNRANLELDTLTVNQSTKISILEINLAAKVEELTIVDKDVAFLREQRIELMKEVDNVTQKLIDQREADAKTCDELRKKLASKTKIIDLYKSMRADSDSKCKELTTGVAELQKLLKNAIDKYGELEAKNMNMEIEHEIAIKEKNAQIKTLAEELEKTKSEMQRAKAESISLSLTNLSPTAAITREFIKSGKSLSQIYSELVAVSDELSKKNDENSQLKLAFQTLLSELEENAPLIRQRNSQYENAVDNHTVLSQQLELTEMEYSQLREDYSESIKLSNHLERENKRLTQELKDLGSQVCFLLKEMEISRAGCSYANNTTLNDDSTASLISKNLVTFNDIQELQLNNQKLLKIVRELTEKQEENDALQEQIETGELQIKLDLLSTKVADLTSAKERQSKQVNDLIKQRDMYKKLYHDKISKDVTKEESSQIMNDIENSFASNKDNTSMNRSYNKNDLTILETQLEDAKKQMNQQKDDQKKFEEMADSKEKLLLRQVSTLRKDLCDLNDVYRKCYCSLETNKEKNKLLQSEVTAQKSRIAALEKCNEEYCSKNAEYDVSIKHFKNKLSIAENEVTKAKNTINRFKKDNQHLKEMNESLLKDRNRLNTEMQTQSVLVNNLDVIKKCVEEKSNEDKRRLESKLEDFSRECSLLQRKLQEKQETFSELQSGKMNINDGKDSMERLKMELMLTKAELEEKTKLLDQSSHLSQVNALTDEIKYLSGQLCDRRLEIENLQQQLIEHKQHTQLLSGVSERMELEAKTISENFVSYKMKAEADLSESQRIILELKEKCLELEAELSLHSISQEDLNNDLKQDLANAQEQCDSLMKELIVKNSELEQLNTRISSLIDNVGSLEFKITEQTKENETHIQTIHNLKEEILDLYKEISNLKDAKQAIVKELDDKVSNWEESTKATLSEKDSLVQHMSDLRDQNMLLMESIETMTKQMAFSQSSTSLNDSSFNVSMDDEGKSTSKLLQVIKYLRKERDAIHANYNKLQDENLSMKLHLDSAEVKLNELNKKQHNDLNTSDVNIQSSRHNDVVYKLETFNAISENNKALRNERDGLLERIGSLSENSTKLEESLSLLQDSTAELTKKLQAMMSENACIQSECNRWKLRANALSERAIKNSPEDWKRLQNERETLTKMLTAEKELVKKLRDEVTVVKMEKNKMEEQNNVFNRQQTTVLEESKKLAAEISLLKKDNVQLSSELNEVKTALSTQTDEIVKLTNDLTNQTNLLRDSQNKEVRLRKIARDYRAQCVTLTKLNESEKETADAQLLPSSDQQDTDTEHKLRERISTLEAQNVTLENNIAELGNINENIKTQISQLIEAKETLSKALADANTKVDTYQQTNEECNDRLVALKSQYEGKIIKLEKEKSQLQQDRQDEVGQLNKQIEALSTRVVQMQKVIEVQQAMKQSASGGQGEKASGETPTANIKPMSGTQQPMGTRRPGTEPPLASIRPMTSGVRTAAVLPTAQYSIAPLHHSSHTTGSTGDSNVASPGGSEFPPNSSVGICHPGNSAAVPTPTDTAQDTEDPMEKGCITVETVSPPMSQVALVSPRIETSTLDNSNNATQQQGSPASCAVTINNSESTASQTESADQNEDQSVQKRARVDTEQDAPQSKRAKVAIRAQTLHQQGQQQDDDDVIIVDSDDEDDDEDMHDEEEEEEVEEEEEDDNDNDNDNDDEEGMEDEDDGMEDVEEEDIEYDNDNDNNQENADDEELEQEVIDEMATAVVEVDAEIPEDEVEEEEEEEEDDHYEEREPDDESQEEEEEEDDDARESDNREQDEAARYDDHRNQPISIRNRPIEGIRYTGYRIYDEGDGIVPSTPTLTVPRRNDGFGEAIRSPMGEHSDGQFSYGDDTNVMESTHADLTNQLEDSRPAGVLVIEISDGGNVDDADERETQAAADALQMSGDAQQVEESGDIYANI